MQGAVTEEDVAECHKKFRDTGKKRSECGTGYLHPWRAEFAKDEDIVGNQIDHERDGADDKPEPCLPDRTHQLLGD